MAGVGLGAPARAVQAAAPSALRRCCCACSRWRRRAAASSGGRFSTEPQAPWHLTFDLRERETEWTEENKARLVALVAAQQLSIPWPQMEQRLDALMLLLPDMGGTLPKLKPALLAGLAADLQQTSARLVALRELLPAANVSRVVAERPQLLLQEPAEVEASVVALKGLLKRDRVDDLVEAQPLLLDTACVADVLEDIRRLIPGCQPEAMLAADPDWILRVQRGQRWLGAHPDSDLGEQVTWQPPGVGGGG